MIVETIIRKYVSHNMKKGTNEKAPSKTRSFLQMLLTFTLVCFAWVFFRANSLSDAFFGLSHMLDGVTSPIRYVADAARMLGLDRYDLLIRLLPVALLAVYDYVNKKADAFLAISKWKPIFRWSVYVIIIWVILFYPGTGSGAEFIYFQF